MNWEILKPKLDPIGRAEDSVHWHKLTMRVVGIVQAPSPEAAIREAKRAGHSAPIVQPAKEAAPDVMVKVWRMARQHAREVVEA